MSPALKVVAPGLHTTIQDRGRFGYQDVGVPVAGPLDDVNLRLANALVGNPPNTAALEILLHGPTLEVAAESVRIALAGTSTSIEVRGDETRTVLPAWRSLRLHRGQVIRVGVLEDSACSYLAVEGGFDIAPCLGSLATYARGGIGGLEGRALMSGDVLPLRIGAADERGEVTLRRTPDLGLADEIRVVLGPQDDHFAEATIETLLTCEFGISAKSDRMGYRLDGPKLQHRNGYNIVSDGIAAGAIQVPGSGQPILLLADHQTTGGYPKIATVISADLPLVGRRRPAQTIRFTDIGVEAAEEVRRQQEADFQRLASEVQAVRNRGELDLARLYNENLVSGAVGSAEWGPE